MVNDLTTAFKSEAAAIASAPALFVVAVAMASILLWRVLDWHYKGRLESRDERLRLKEETIAHLAKNAGVQVQASLQRRDWTDRLAEETPLDKRVFVSGEVTIDYLTGLYEGRTHVQGDRLAEPYKGKWIEITGSVEIMTALGNSATTVTLTPYSVQRRPLFVWMMFLADRDKLETIPLSGELTAVGKIDEIGRDEIKLLQCQLL